MDSEKSQGDKRLSRGRIGPLGGRWVPQFHNALSNPTLELFDHNGQRVGFNDNWGDDSTQAAQLQALNIAPGNAAESAIVTTLPPGLYTAVVAGQAVSESG